MIDCLLNDECLFAATAVTQAIFVYVAACLFPLLIIYWFIDDLEQILGYSSARSPRKSVNYWMVCKRWLRRCAARCLSSARRKPASRAPGDSDRR